jgi:hydroxymethylbilane synthase
MKDVPVALPEGLHLPVMMARADARDALVSAASPSLAALPRGALVGTSSLRRQCQLRSLRPDLRLQSLRGGVDTRLGKLDTGEFDAILLACAGLDRLQRADRIRERIGVQTMIPAIGQGAMGIECRRGDAAVEAMIAVLHDDASGVCVRAERALNERLEGGCQVPIAGHAVLEGETLHLRALVASLDGTRVIRDEARAPRAQFHALGTRVADALLAQGAGAILREVYASAG